MPTKRHKHSAIALLMVLLMTIASHAQDEIGQLTFVANGEDFVRQSFTSKDGWRIDFEHVYIVLDDIRAYQTNPPYDPYTGELTRAQTMIGLGETYIIDLAEGDANATPILVDRVADATAGYYNALAWRLAAAPEDAGEMAGYTLRLVGTASNDEQSVDFDIAIDEAYTFQCGAFVGDTRKGILPAGEAGEVEMTFHFDHIFGDRALAADDALNMGAVGFMPFAALADDDTASLTLSELREAWDAPTYARLEGALTSLGHVGEGHCHEG